MTLGANCRRIELALLTVGACVTATSLVIAHVRLGQLEEHVAAIAETIAEAKAIEADVNSGTPTPQYRAILLSTVNAVQAQVQTNGAIMATLADRLLRDSANCKCLSTCDAPTPQAPE